MKYLGLSDEINALFNYNNELYFPGYDFLGAAIKLEQPGLLERFKGYKMHIPKSEVEFSLLLSIHSASDLNSMVEELITKLTQNVEK